MNLRVTASLLAVLTFGCSRNPTPSRDLQDRDLAEVVRVECSANESGRSSEWCFAGMVQQWDSARTSLHVQGLLDSLCQDAEPLLVVESGCAAGYLYRAWVVSGCSNKPLCLSITMARPGVEPEVLSRRLELGQFRSLAASMVERLSTQGTCSEFSDLGFDGSREIISVWAGGRLHYFLSTGFREEQFRQQSSLQWISALTDSVFWSKERTGENDRETH
jgi:hypothetical protein